MAHPVRARLALALLVSLAACSPYRPPEPTPFERYELGREGGTESRDSWFWDQRTYPAGSIPLAAHRRAVAQELARGRATLADGPAWTELGPRPLRDIPYGFPGTSQNSSGRLLTVAVHPTDSSVVLVGAAQGGIWKSTDRGSTFRAVGESALPTLAVNVIRFDPSNPEVIYAGTGEAHGSSSIHGAGIVKSTDGGETWELLPTRGDGWDFEYASITGIVIDARDSNQLWASAATIATRIARPAQPPSGVFRSTDGGRSWTLVHLATRYTIAGEPAPSAGVMDLEHGGAGAPDLLYASEYYGGIFRSDDAGASWRRITPTDTTGLGRLPAPVPALDYYDSRSLTFKRYPRLPRPDGLTEFRRIEIGVSPANPQIIYAGVDALENRLDRNGNGTFDGSDPRYPAALLFKSSDGGTTWSWLGSWGDGVPDYCGTQCYFDNIVAVNPNDADDVIIAGSANYTRYWPDPITNPTRLLAMPWRGMVYRSSNGGATWNDLTPHCTGIGTTSRTYPGVTLPVFDCNAMDARTVIHPDSHAAAFAPDGALWIANDGGLYRTGGSSAWENVNDSLGTLQFYKIALHPTDPNIMLGGMQDNSAGYWNGTTWEGWGAGDGTIALFDPIDPRWVYLGSQFSIHRHAGGGVKSLFDDSWDVSVFSALQIRAGESVSFVPAVTMDPRDPRILYAGTNRAIYRTDDRGNTWQRVTDDDLDGTPMTIEVAAGDSNRIFVGTSTGKIYLIDLRAATGRRRIVRRADWISATVTDLTQPGLPNRTVSRILAPTPDPSLVYALFTGYDANTPETPGKVFVSRDAGASWTNISNGLPDAPASAMAADPLNPNRLWIGTDLAVYASSDGGASWHSDRGNMPIVSVLDLQFNAKTGLLVAATHGRGIWRRAVDAAASR